MIHIKNFSQNLLLFFCFNPSLSTMSVLMLWWFYLLFHWFFCTGH